MAAKEPPGQDCHQTLEKQSKPRQAQLVSAIGSCASSSETVSLSVLPSTQFIAGNIANCLRAWKNLTTDEVLLKIVTGYELEFTQTPFQSKIPHKIHLGEEEFQIINTEINKLLHKEVIVKTNHSEGEFISDIFCRPKKDGSHRLILNLKKLNHYVEYHHFKMETFQNVLQLIKPHC